MNPQQDSTSDTALKAQLREGAGPELWAGLRERTATAEAFEEVLRLSTFRRRAQAQRLSGGPSESCRLGVVGGYTPRPLVDLLEHFLSVKGLDAELVLGEFDNYAAEILEPGGVLYQERVDALLFLPSPRLAASGAELLQERAAIEDRARAQARELLGLCTQFNGRAGVDVVLGNYPLSPGIDLGPYRSKTLASDWSFRKLLNLELGLSAPPHVHICDLEFLSARLGTTESSDPRRWFESKQPGSPRFLVELAREAAEIVVSLRRSDKKVLVLDLDNTLWGGVIGDDGIDGIELGGHSPRGEAFKAMQEYVASLKQRGLLLAVASKNDHEVAEAAIRDHPEMALRMEDFAAFRANWEPKSDNIRSMADELNLGLDSFVFVDDNPAEIEIVRQFASEVATIQLSEDPSDHVRRLADSGHFRRLMLTQADAARADQYQAEARRRQAAVVATDMGSYLASLEMTGTLRPFLKLDLPRVVQLINRSNQFNLTTRRRTQAEVEHLLTDNAFQGFTVRLADRFGDHGLISVVITQVQAQELWIDTWLMSCRVLKRGVEDEVLAEIVRQAKLRGCDTVVGRFLPTAKNGMVRDLYPNLGFQAAEVTPEAATYSLRLRDFKPRSTYISVTRELHEENVK